MSEEGRITTSETFHERLRELVAEASAAGIDVEGGWPLLNGKDGPHWDVEIVEVERDR